MTKKRIVLLHGWGAGTKKLVSLKSSLEELGWEVFLPKIPGFDTVEPSHAWELSNYSEYIRKVVKSRWKNENYFIFGHSFGGRIAIKMTSESAKNISGIILCASGGISRDPYIKRIVFLIIAKIGKLFLVYKPFAIKFRKLLYKVVGEHDYEKSSDLMKQTMQNVINEDLKPLISTIHVKTLIIWGKNDKVTPYKDALFLKSQLNKSKLITFSHEGHTLPYYKPNEITKEINKWG